MRLTTNSKRLKYSLGLMESLGLEISEEDINSNAVSDLRGDTFDERLALADYRILPHDGSMVMIPYVYEISRDIIVTYDRECGEADAITIYPDPIIHYTDDTESTIGVSMQADVHGTMDRPISMENMRQFCKELFGSLEKLRLAKERIANGTWRD